MRFGLAQINFIVGAPSENLKKIIAWVDKHSSQVDVFVFPELSLIGYPCRDLLSFPKLIEQEKEALEKLVDYTRTSPAALLIGHTSPSNGFRPYYNSASLIGNGKIIGTVHKHRIPSYNIFEEDRFFEAAPAQNCQFEWKSQRLGIFVCEDGWQSVEAFGKHDLRTYKDNCNPLHYLKGADFAVNLSASPFSLGKSETREDLFSAHAQKLGIPLVYVNTSGAHDDLIFDGGSFVVDAQGQKPLRLSRFQEDFQVWDSTLSQKSPSFEPLPYWEEMRQSLVLGIRDYFEKSKVKKALLGLSGGIDSTLLACLAVEALGKDNVIGVTLSSDLSSQESVDDAHALAKNLGIQIKDHKISKLVNTAENELGLQQKNLTYENLQSRARALLLMALSNELGAFVLATSNKSELAMGYGTLYGDMCGALMPLGDLLKTEVFGLAHYLNICDLKNSHKGRIPLNSVLRAPTAELAPGQKDEDSLPPYEKLDTFLGDYLHNLGTLRGKNISGWDSFLGPQFSVDSLSKKIHSQEFKRRQSAPVLRVHNRAFGQSWRMPLAKGFSA